MSRTASCMREKIKFVLFFFSVGVIFIHSFTGFRLIAFADYRS